MVSGYGRVCRPVLSIEAVTNGFWCSRANLIAAAWLNAVVLQGESLHQVAVAALVDDAQALTVDLPARKHVDLRRGRVKRRRRAHPQLHKERVRIRYRNAEIPRRRVTHIREVVHRQPVVSRVARAVMPAVREQLGADHRADLFVPDVGRINVERIAPGIERAEILGDLVLDVDAVNVAIERHAWCGPADCSIRLVK